MRLPATVGRAATDAGASIVVGHGPHSVQPVEIYQGIPIFYSLGNLVFDWPAMQDRHLHGLLITTTFEDRVTITPTARDADNTARILTGAAAHGVLDAFVALSAPLARASASTATSRCSAPSNTRHPQPGGIDRH